MISDITFPMVVYSIPTKGVITATMIADNGSALIASYMKEEEIRPLILDYNTPESMRIISEQGKDGFKDHVIETLAGLYMENDVRIAATKLFSNGFADSMEIHRKLKERVPGLVVVAHGPHANWYGEEILNLYPDSVDIVSTGHGEVNATGLAKWAYCNDGILEEIPNIMFRSNGGGIKKTGREFADLNILPPPTYDKEFYPDIDDKILLPMLDGSRGCPHAKCIFCAQPPHMGPYMERKTSNLLRDVEYLTNTFGVNRSRLTDSSPKPERINQFLKGLPEGHRTSFFARVSTDYDFSLMDGRVAAMFIGFETVRDDILMLYRKTDDPGRYKRDFEELVAGCRGAGISTTASMIVPSPWETDRTIRDNQEYVIEVNPDFVIALPLGILPKTPIERMVLRGEDVGVRLDPGYNESMMRLELDLLDLNVGIPYEMITGGRYNRKMLEASRKFMIPLMERGIFPASDENVTIADMFFNGLSRDQGERREQVIQLSNMMRNAADNMDYLGMRKLIRETRVMPDG